MTRALFCWAYFFVLFFTSNTLADSRRTTAYDYDASGNIVSVSTESSDALPVVLSVQPSSVRINTPLDITIIGTGLNEVLISTDAIGLVVADILTTETQINLTLSADKTVPLGAHTLLLTTLLGTASAEVEVLPPLPLLNIAPVPVVVPVNGGSVALDLRLTLSDLQDHIINLSVSDESIATVTPATVTITQGDVVPSEVVTLVGGLAGTTQLSISSATLPDRNLSVQASTEFTQSIGDNNRFFSSILGVNKDSPDAETELRGPVIGLLGVVKGEFISPVNQQNEHHLSQSLIALKGRGIQSINPLSVLSGANTVDLVVSGAGLNAVDAASVIPSDGVTLGSPIASADGLTVTIPISVDNDTPFALRQLQLSAAGQSIGNITSDADRFYVGGGVPIVSHVEPITVSRLSHFTLEVVGQNLHAANAVIIEPSAGLTIGGDLTVNEEGSSLSVSIAVDEFADLGPRVVRVDTVTGLSTATLLPSNTLHITNGPGDTLTPLVAAAVGIFKADATQSTRELSTSSAVLAIAKGTHLSALLPSVETIGNSFTLTVEGAGLNAVDSVSFVPSQGVAVGSIVPAVDGQSIAVDITLAANAETSLRQIQLASAGIPVPVASPQANRFRIVPPQPNVVSVTPLNIQAGAAPTQLMIQGSRLNDVIDVLIIPADDMTIGLPVESADGTQITIAVAASASAASGNRTVVVQTAGGQSSAVAGLNNTLTVVSEITNVATPILSAVLGINKLEEPTNNNINQLVVSGDLTVDKLIDEPAGQQGIALQTPVVQVVKGSFATAINPSIVSIGETINLTISGTGLDTVSTVSVEPSDGLTVGNFSVNAEGTLITVSVDADLTAPQTLRQVTLSSASGQVLFTEPSNRQLLVADDPPVITSLEPLLVVQGGTTSMVIRGDNLQLVTSINALPATGLLFDDLQFNAEGTEITVDVVVAVDALSGPRVITVTTPGGTSSAVASETNTLTVVE